jgi:hypothetical protein
LLRRVHFSPFDLKTLTLLRPTDSKSDFRIDTVPSFSSLKSELHRPTRPNNADCFQNGGRVSTNPSSTALHSNKVSSSTCHHQVPARNAAEADQEHQIVQTQQQHAETSTGRIHLMLLLQYAVNSSRNTLHCTIAKVTLRSGHWALHHPVHGQKIHTTADCGLTTSAASLLSS